MKQKFTVSGMSCAACSAAVERAVSRLDGVSAVSVALLAKTMLCEYDENTVTAADIVKAVKKAGFRARPANTEAETADKTADSGELSVKTRLIVSAAFLVPLMYVSMGGMLGLPLPPFLSGMANAVSFAFIQFILTLPVLYVNRKFFTNGFGALVRRAPNMDTLVALGASASAVYGAAAVCLIGNALGAGDMETVHRYAHNLYFESAAMILTLVTVGKYLEERSKSKTRSAISALRSLAPDTASVIRDGVETSLPSAEIIAGDIVVIRPGERVPADGVVTEGTSEVDESALTGESMAVPKSAGDRVLSASLNKNGSFRFRATGVGSDTTLAKIIELVEDASATKAPVTVLADKVAGVFVPVVIGLAALTAAVWLIFGGYSDRISDPVSFALTSAVAVLVISCPCALGLATPVAVTVAAGRCASKGILIKSAAALEALHGVSTVVFDKTGTLTEGRPETVAVRTFGTDERGVMTAAAALERKSEHSLAGAVLEYAERLGITDPPDAEDFAAVPGRGVTGTVTGVKYHLGNAAFMRETAHAELPDESDDAVTDGATPLYLAANGRLTGIIYAADRPRPTSAAAVKRLREAGIRVLMLTGDNKKTADAVGRTLGVDGVISEVLPDGKEAVVAELQKSGTVAMVGDGINDSPALTRADVGIAVSGGSDIAVDCADLILLKNDPEAVADAVVYSKKTMRNIRENLFWAFFYNVVCIPLAAGALYIPFGIALSPMVAAAAMSLSSLFVVSNALRLRRL